jgi:ankyrin repeat protein
MNMTIFLLDKGAHLEKRFEGMALTRAVESRIDMLRLLLSRGVNPNSTYMGATPLAHACLKKDFEVIKILLESGADINIRSSFPGMPYDGKSAVDIAKENGDPQLTKLIIGNSVK